MNKMLLDIECYKNYFCCGIKQLNTTERCFYEISEEKNKLKELVSDISHQTKTPIANIKLYFVLQGIILN